jgi:hypothetical protein
MVSDHFITVNTRRASYAAVSGFAIRLPALFVPTKSLDWAQAETSLAGNSIT